MYKNPAFIELLVSREIVTEEASQRLLNKHKGDAFAVLTELVRENTQKKDALAGLWADTVGAAYVDLSKSLFQREVVHQLPEDFAQKNRIILIYQFGEAITAATAEPTNHFVRNEAERITGKPISLVFSLPEDIETAIELEYESEDRLKLLSSKMLTEYVTIEDINELTRDELQRIAGNQGVIELVKGLMNLGVREHASDIHIEPWEDKVRVRFRIDGVLQERSKLEKTLLAPIVSRLKILAELDITERRRPQDGRVTLSLPNRTVDFRFSSIPTISGEKAVLRILGQSETSSIPDLTDLGFSKSIFHMVRRVAEMPYGIFFVTGPTGSGKTTTLFSMLKYLSKPGINITTIEDPVEYRLPGINQVQVNAAADLDFPSALRSFLRQDPDVILVGEIRDQETAEIACRAALTGHLVLATLHSNNAVQATTRLIDMGVQPHIVAPSITGVISQRLVRRICENCKEKYPVPVEEVRRILVWDGTEVSFFRGKGCSRCSHSGYSGRIAIHEMVLISDILRSQLARGASAIEIHHTARKGGFQTMRYDGMKKVLRGLTTMEELDRVTIAEEEEEE